MILYRQCPLCASSHLTGDAMDLHRRGPHISRARCKSCGLVFANPMADQKDLEKYYNDYYEKEVYENTDYKNIILTEIAAISKMDKAQITKRAPYFSNFSQTGKFLDIGCETIQWGKAFGIGQIDPGFGSESLMQFRRA